MSWFDWVGDVFEVIGGAFEWIVNGIGSALEQIWDELEEIDDDLAGQLDNIPQVEYKGQSSPGEAPIGDYGGIEGGG